jgi:hypothetical protein
MLVFKVALQPKGNKFWFSLKCAYWWPSLVLAGSLVVYQFSQSLIMNLFVFPFVQSAGYLGSSFKSILMTFILLAFFSGFTLLTLFGTHLAHLTTHPLSFLSALLRDSILDYTCAGSNTWVYLCLHCLPALIVTAKILIN